MRVFLNGFSFFCPYARSRQDIAISHRRASHHCVFVMIHGDATHIYENVQVLPEDGNKTDPLDLPGMEALVDKRGASRT